MAIEFPEPAPGGPPEISHEDAVVQAQANVAIQHWLLDHPEVTDKITETIRAHVHLGELAEQTRDAEHARRDAEQRDAAHLTRHDPAGQRVLGFVAGSVLVILLVVLDAVPLNWAAQAFGLDSGGTSLVTLILAVASIGAMLGFELTSRHPRRRALLAAVVGIAYLALLMLRTQFLTTVAGESFPVALLQSAMLTAISAGLVLCGSAVLARTRSLSFVPVARHRAPRPADSGRRPCRAERGHEQPAAAHRRAPSDAAALGARLRRAGRSRPWPVGRRSRGCRPPTVSSVVISGRPLSIPQASLPPADTSHRSHDELAKIEQPVWSCSHERPHAEL